MNRFLQTHVLVGLCLVIVSCQPQANTQGDVIIPVRTPETNSRDKDANQIPSSDTAKEQGVSEAPSPQVVVPPVIRIPESGQSSDVPPTSTPVLGRLESLKAQYESSIGEIINTRCQSCHADISELNFDSFDSVTSLASSMAGSVSSGRMPLGPKLPVAEKEKLMNFLNAISESFKE